MRRAVVYLPEIVVRNGVCVVENEVLLCRIGEFRELDAETFLNSPSLDGCYPTFF